jgi:hypothetical protein
MEEGQPLETIIENSKMNLPNEADDLVCGEHQIDSTGAEVAEVKSSSVIQNQDCLDKKEVSLSAELTFLFHLWDLSFLSRLCFLGI